MSLNYKSQASLPYDDNALQVLGAFLVNRKPIEYLFLSEGAHNLLRPRERVAMMGSVVD